MPQDSGGSGGTQANISRLNVNHWDILQLKLMGWPNADIARELKMSQSTVSAVVNSAVFQDEMQAEASRKGIDISNAVDAVYDRCEEILMETLTFGTIRFAKRDARGNIIPDQYTEETVPAEQVVKEARAILLRRQKPPRQLPRQVNPPSEPIITPNADAAPGEPGKVLSISGRLGDQVIDEYKLRAVQSKQSPHGEVTVIPRAQHESNPDLILAIPSDKEAGQ